MTRNSNPGLQSRTRWALSLVLASVLSGCGLGYVAIGAILLQDDGGSDPATPDTVVIIDTTQPDLVVTNLQAPPVGTIVGVQSGSTVLTTVQFSSPITFQVVNIGTDVAPAGFNTSLFLSPSKSLADPQAVRIRDIPVNVTTQVGEFTRMSSDNNQNIASVSLGGAARVLRPGSFFLLARVNSVNPIVELFTDNNDTLAVGQIQIFDTRDNANQPLPAAIPSEPQGGAPGSPNFVLEDLTVPSFAFPQDAVNAGQQPVNGLRSFNIGAQVALRGAATGVEETVELRLFLSTDQSLSGDDLPILAPIPVGQTAAPPILLSFPASSAGSVRQFEGLTVQLPTLAGIGVTLPQTFFIIGQVVPSGNSGAPSQELARDAYDNTRPARMRTRVYGRFVASDRAVLPDLTVDGPTRIDPEPLLFTTTAFSIPTPGSQRIFSFQIPDVPGIDPDQSQVIILLQSQDFDPTLELLGPVGGTIRNKDDSANGTPAFVSAPLTASGAGNNLHYVVISSRSGTGSGNFNLTIFLQSRTDPNKAVIQPVNLGNILSLDRAQARVTSGAVFPVSLTAGSALVLAVDGGSAAGGSDATVTFDAGGLIADLSAATAFEVRDVINSQAGNLVSASVESNRLVIRSLTSGNTSALRVGGAAGAALGFPLGEPNVSESVVTFDFAMNQADREFIFFIPTQGAFNVEITPSIDQAGGVNGSLQFFDGQAQRSLGLSKTSQGAARTVFSSPLGGPSALARGFYAFVLNAPQAIPGVPFRLTLRTRFDRTIIPQ